MHLVRLISSLYVCLIMLAGISSAQQTIHLKKRLLRTPDNLEAYRVGPLVRRNVGRSHYLIQFSARPTPAQVQELRNRGARVTSYVPDAGLVVSSPDDSSWDGLDLKYVGRLDELDKLSSHLSERQTLDQMEISVVVEFHNDVAMADARALVAERNLAIIERDSLPSNELLVQGPLERILRLSEWDE